MTLDALLEDVPKTIKLLDYHTAQCLEYLSENAGDPLDTRTVIWNQMSALLSEVAREGMGGCTRLSPCNHRMLRWAHSKTCK